MNGFDDRRRVSGFTLIELLMTIVVLAILATIVAPDMTEMIQRNRIDAHANDLTTAFSVARNAAIQRGENSSVVAADGQSLTQGWRIESASFSSAAPQILQSNPQGMKDAAFCGNDCNDKLNETGISEIQSVTFNARGGLDTVNGKMAQFFSVTLIPKNCVSGKRVGRIIEVVATGRTVTQQALCP